MDKQIELDIGDIVEIANFGQMAWIHKKYYALELAKLVYEKQKLILPVKPPNIISEDDTYYTVDRRPELVGRKGMICSNTGKTYDLIFSDGGTLSSLGVSQLKLFRKAQ